MATVSLVNGSDSDEIWGNMIHNFNNFANTALTVNQEIYKSESATTSTTAALPGCWTATAIFTIRRP